MACYFVMNLGLDRLLILIVAPRFGVFHTQVLQIDLVLYSRNDFGYKSYRPTTSWIATKFGMLFCSDYRLTLDRLSTLRLPIFGFRTRTSSK